MNRYLEIIKTLSLQNSATQQYISLCEGAILRREISGYVEKHHILPKCICRSNEEKLDKQNLVIFSAKEHFTAHRLLSGMFGGIFRRKMLYALSALSFRRNGARILDEEEYAITKEASRLAKKGIPLSKEHKQKIRDAFAIHNPNKGRIASEETREKHRKRKVGIPRSEEIKDKISKSLSGISKPPLSNSHRESISKACKGRKSPSEGIKQPLLSCVFCKKTGGAYAIKQHHFNKCGDY